MSKEVGRTIRVRTVDDTTAVMLGVSRTLRSVSREIHFLSALMKVLANDEIMAGVAAMQMGAMMQLAIPVIGVIAAGISIAAGAQITAQRAAIPVAQTSPGHVRQVMATGQAIVHRGEMIGSPPFAVGQVSASTIHSVPFVSRMEFTARPTLGVSTPSPIGLPAPPPLTPSPIAGLPAVGPPGGVVVMMNGVDISTAQDVHDTVVDVAAEIWRVAKQYK